MDFKTEDSSTDIKGYMCVIFFDYRTMYCFFIAFLSFVEGV